MAGAMDGGYTGYPKDLRGGPGKGAVI